MLGDKLILASLSLKKSVGFLGKKKRALFGLSISVIHRMLDLLTA
jgi:hypothetical protein